LTALKGINQGFTLVLKQRWRRFVARGIRVIQLALVDTGFVAIFIALTADLPTD
jgi:hypothetical protein